MRHDDVWRRTPGFADARHRQAQNAPGAHLVPRVEHSRGGVAEVGPQHVELVREVLQGVFVIDVELDGFAPAARVVVLHNLQNISARKQLAVV